LGYALRSAGTLTGKSFCFFFQKEVLSCFPWLSFGKERDMHHRNGVLAAALLIALSAGAASAQSQYPGQDPDWPCAQRLVATLTPGSYWAGPVPSHTAWRDDEKIFPLVTDIVNRDTADDDGLTRLNAYVDTIPADQRATAIPFLFGAIVDQTNDERTLLIQRIKQLGLRQRRMGDVVAKISTQVDELQPTDSRYHDLAGERDFDVRAFQETQHTMRYACEAPAAMERRLGVYARVLQAKLSKK
jgi:hypothetical protein